MRIVFKLAVAAAMAKLDVRSRVAAVAEAERLGIVSPPAPVAVPP